MERIKLQEVDRKKKCVRDLGDEERKSPVLEETDRKRRMLNSIVILSKVKIQSKTGFDQEKEQRF